LHDDRVCLGGQAVLVDHHDERGVVEEMGESKNAKGDGLRQGLTPNSKYGIGLAIAPRD
jgi:hypothetical protein